MRLIRGFLVAFLLAAIASLGGAQAAFADVDDFAFDELTVDYTLTRAEDGTSRLHVVERFVARFPDVDQNRGIRRSIPAWYNGQPLRPSLVSVTDGDGRARPAETDEEDGVFSVVSRADDYLHGAQTFEITYDLENVTWDFPDTGLEFYWDVNGVDWRQPFGRIVARLHLDAELADAVTGEFSCYQGAQDASTACTYRVTEPEEDGDGVVLIAVADAVGPYETLTVAVGFEQGTFATFDSSYLASPLGWAQGVAGVGLVGAGVFAVRARRTALADEPGRPTIIAEYTPPPGIDALESAVLLGRSSKAIAAEVLEQAVVGSIRIIEGERGLFGRAPLIAELVDRSRADHDGRMLLDALFPAGTPGEQYTFGRQDTRLSTKAQKILTRAEKELKRRGLRRDVPAGARAWPVVTTVVAAALVFFLGIAAVDSGVNAVVPVALMVLAGVVFGFVIAAVARKPLSAKGAEVRDHLKGLEEFIAWAEADRIRMLQSPAGAERVAVDVDDPRQKLKLYETLLPYAVVFGQEKEWSKQLAVLYSQTGAVGPYWYVGTGSFDASAFSSSIGSLSSAATSSSSTSGGSSGGGSAGGGGGGGGGGGV
jgi:Predicted membrane protein